MAVTYTSNLKLGLPTTGTESGTWGNVVNQQITTLVDQAISGTVSLTSMTNADYTLTNGDGNAANEARYMALLVPSSLTLTAARNIIVPSTSKTYIVKNATTGGFSVTVKTSAGTGIAVPNGNEMLLYCDGTNVVVAFDTINVNSVNSGQLAGLRNRIINGGAVINQRVSATVGTVGVYSADRWIVAIIGGTGITATSNNGGLVGSPSGFGVYLGGTWTSGKPVFAQRIESYNAQDLVGKTITISGYINAPVGINDTYDIILIAPTATDNYTSTSAIGTNTTATITGGTTTFFSTTFSATTMNVANIVNGLQLQIQKTNAVSHGTTVNYALGGVQLEIGSVATPFEQRPIGMELALCQRYYWNSLTTTGSNQFPILIGYQAASSSVHHWYKTPVTMRAVPTVTVAGGASWTLTNCSAPATLNSSVDFVDLYVTATATGAYSANINSGALAFTSACEL